MKSVGWSGEKEVAFDGSICQFRGRALKVLKISFLFHSIMYYFNTYLRFNSKFKLQNFQASKGFDCVIYFENFQKALKLCLNFQVSFKFLKLMITLKSFNFVIYFRNFQKALKLWLNFEVSSKVLKIQSFKAFDDFKKLWLCNLLFFKKKL